MGVEFVVLILVLECLFRRGRIVEFFWVILVVGMGGVRLVGTLCLRVDGLRRWRLGCVSVVSCCAGCG